MVSLNQFTLSYNDISLHEKDFFSQKTFDCCAGCNNDWFFFVQTLFSDDSCGVIHEVCLLFIVVKMKFLK